MITVLFNLYDAIRSHYLFAYIFFIIVLWGASRLYLLFQNRRLRHAAKLTQQLSLHRYAKAQDLNTRDINVVKSVMGEARLQIREIEQLVAKSTVLKRSTRIQQAKNASMVLFKELINHPQDIIDHPDFFYSQLPDFVALLHNFHSLDNSQVSTSEIRQARDKLLEALKQQADDLVDQFELYTQNLLEHIHFDKHTSKNAKPNQYFDIGYQELFDPSFSYYPKELLPIFKWRGLLVMAAILTLLTPHTQLSQTTSDSSFDTGHFTDSYPLKKIGLTITDPVKKTKTVSFELKEDAHSLVLSTGYTLSWPQVLYVSQKNDLSQASLKIEPKSDMAFYSTSDLLTLSEPMKDQYDFPITYQIQKSDNLIDGLYDLLGDQDKQQIFQFSPIGKIKNGYVVTYHTDDSGNCYSIELDRYFLFPDGSGLVIKTNYAMFQLVGLLEEKNGLVNIKELKTYTKATHFDTVRQLFEGHTLPDQSFKLTKPNSP